MRGPGEQKGMQLRCVAKTIMKLANVEPAATMGGNVFDLSGL
jgi:hypothetical protein